MGELWEKALILKSSHAIFFIHSFWITKFISNLILWFYFDIFLSSLCFWLVVRDTWAYLHPLALCFSYSAVLLALANFSPVLPPSVSCSIHVHLLTFMIHETYCFWFLSTLSSVTARTCHSQHFLPLLSPYFTVGNLKSTYKLIILSWSSSYPDTY